MNLYPYFDEVDFSKLKKEASLNWQYSLGASINKNTIDFNNEQLDAEIAIIGVPFETSNGKSICISTPNKIRKQLYALAEIDNLNVIDLGDLKPASSHKGNFLALRDVIEHLNNQNITTIILGGSQDYSIGVCQSFRNNPFFSFSNIDATLDIAKGQEPLSAENYLSHIFKEQANIFQFNLLAFQSYYIPSYYFEKIKDIGNHLRLGNIRGDITLTEPIFRNSDFLSFDFCSLKHSETYGKAMYPNGLYSEEACQLAKYAGLSNRLKVFGLFGVNSILNESQISINLAAQVIWYFLDGCLNRDKTAFDDSDNYTVFTTEIQEINTPLIFYKNKNTLQWWMQVRSLNNDAMFFACSEKDYLTAENGEIPESWLRYVQKIDKLLK